jgi:prepilin-type N-terminal cleavage/methylation domain-containing protein
MTKKTSKYSKDAAGFTLMELMVTVALVALLSAISLPGILSGLPEKRLKSAARDLYATLQKARLLAVKINREVRVEFIDDGANSSFVIDVQENAGESYAEDGVRLYLSDYGGVSYGTAGATADWEDKVLPPAAPTKLVVFTKTGTVDTLKTDPLGTFPLNIYLDNESQTACYAVSVEIYGSSRILRYSPGSGWGN